MAQYLNIPDMVESEPLHSVSPDPDRVTFNVVIDVGDTLTQLMRASDVGQHLPLVVLALDSGFIALDSVYVASVSMNAGDSTGQVTFQAQDVRHI